MNSSDAVIGKLYLAAAFILAGTSVIAARFVSAYIPPFATTFFSLVFATLTALLFCGRNMVQTARHLTMGTWVVIGLQALFGSFLFRIFLTMGLQHIGTTEAGIITGATPAITALFTWIMLHEKPNGRTAAGICITLIGILLVQGFPFEMSAAGFQVWGIVLVLCSAACESLFTTLSRRVHVSGGAKDALPPAVHAGFVSMIAMVLCLIPTLFEHPWSAVASLPLSGWIALIWYGSIITIVAFACMFAGAKRCGGYTIAAFAGIIPITSTLLSVVLLHEPISAYQVGGCALVVLATLVISAPGKKTVN